MNDSRAAATLAELEQRDDFVGRHIGPDEHETRAMLATLRLGSLDELVGRSGLTADALSVILLHLELEGQLATLPGGRYQRLRNG